MRVIDILNKISKGEEVPKRIKCDGEEYKITKVSLEDNNYWLNYINEDMECIFPTNTNHLNDEVEIIEFKEDKKIKKLGVINYSEDPATALIHNKVDEIIDYLNNKEK